MKSIQQSQRKIASRQKIYLAINEQSLNRRILFCILFIAHCQFSYAQQKIQLQPAIDTALQNNLSVKNEKLKAEYQQLLVGTAGTIAPTNISAEAGQINSIYTDTRLGVSQSFALPAVYKRQRELLQQETKQSFLSVAVKESVLKKQVEQTFYHLLYLENKQQLLQSLDSLFDSFLQKAILRLKNGEANVLEKAMAENQLAQVKVQLQQLLADRKAAQLQFQLLLNSPTVFAPVAGQYKMSFSGSTDTSLLNAHPYLRQIQQQQDIAKAAIKAEQAKLLPEFLVGVNNMSIRGTGADDKVYASSHRFTSVQAGIAVPIFTRAQKAKVKAARFSNNIAVNKYNSSVQALQAEYDAALLMYQKHWQTVDYMEKNNLVTAALISSTASLQFSNGSINYLEWAMLVNQSVATQNDYIEAVKNLNDAIIQLRYFNNN
jgi:cobalt-zinc-cadmium resistance protein CzcA